MPIVETQHVVCHDVAPVGKAGGLISLLGPQGRGMRFKVSREQPRASDVVEVSSRRCLVGSAPRCDVRIDAPGVAPVACLIFQGSKNNVVRWLDASLESAGGEVFQDEILFAGDPLQIGPVELELLVDEIMASDEPPSAGEIIAGEILAAPEDHLAQYIARLERLELQLVELQQASDETDRDLWSSERAELEALFQSRLGDFDCLQNEVQSLRDELAAVRSEYTGRRLADVSQELAEQAKDFEREQTNWERDRSEFQRQLLHHQERLEQFGTQLAEQITHQAESEAARQAAEERANRLQESVDELSLRLAQQQEDFESVRATWEAERESLESALAETQQRLADAAAVESTGRELRDAWDRERTTLQSQIDEAVSRGEEAQRELEAQRRQPEEHSLDQPSHAPQRLDRADVATFNPMDRLLAGSSQPNDCDEESDDPLQNFLALKPEPCDEARAEDAEVIAAAGEYGGAADGVSNYYEQAFSGLNFAASPNDSPDDEDACENPLRLAKETSGYDQIFEATEPASDEAEEVVFEPASAAPPVSTADVLARLGHAEAWSDDEKTDPDDPSTVTVGHAPNEAYSRFALSDAVEPQEPRPKSEPARAASFNSPFAKPAVESEDEEESIEAYMSRLMNRVRGTNEQDPPAPNPQPAAERTPVTEYTEIATAPQTVQRPDPAPFSPEEYKPRSQAPELADRMTAMRSLANDSARSAIASHAKRNWSSVMQLKLLVSVFAFVAVVGSVIFFWEDPLLMGLGSLLGVGVLAYWARTAITYRRLLLDSLMLDPKFDDPDDK